MAKRSVDIDSWKRRKKFDFFIEMLNPIFSITTRINLDNCYHVAKSRGHSLFLYYSYAIIKAINEIGEFRLRVHCEGDEIVVSIYDDVDLVTPISTSSDGEFTEVRIKYNPDFEEFYCSAEQIISSASIDMDPIVEHIDDATYAVVSALPFLDFTSVSPTLIERGGVDQVPLIVVGKMTDIDGKKSVPISIAAHHGFVDGYQIGLFFEHVQNTLDSY